MKFVLFICLLEVFLNPQLHTVDSSQNESNNGTVVNDPSLGQTASQEPLDASVAEPSVTVTEKEEHAVAQNSSTPASAEYDELRTSPGYEQNDAIPPNTDIMGAHNLSDTPPLPSLSETAIYPPTSISLVVSTTPLAPPQSPPINPTSPPEGGDEDLTFEEFKKKRVQEMPRPPQLESPPQLPLNKAKNNYASYECGARVIETNKEAQNSMAILTENKDAYMLNPCKANISFTVELCDTVRILKLEMGCFELFSSVPETFRVYSSERHPTDEWNFMGEFNASNERVLQSFVPKESAYAKFVRVEMISHYGKEHYCPISVFRVIGTSLVEEFEYSEARKTTIVTPTNEDESDEYLQLGEEQGPGNGRLLAVAKDAVLSLLEPFSRLGNGLIHKDRAPNCKDSSCTPGDGLPPLAQSPLLEKGQDAEALPDQAKVEQVLSVSGTTENLQKSGTAVNEGGVFSEQDVFPGDTGANHHSSATLLGPSGTVGQEGPDTHEHSDVPSLSLHITPSSTGTPVLLTATDGSRFQMSVGQEGSVWVPPLEEQQPSVGPRGDAAKPSVVQGMERSLLAPAVLQATPASEQQQEVPSVPLEEGVVITPDFPNGIVRSGVPPDVAASKGVSSDGAALGPHTVDSSNPSTPPTFSSVVPISSHESVRTPQPGSQGDARPGSHPVHGEGEEEGSRISGDNKSTPTLDASAVVHAVPPMLSVSDTEKGPSQPECNISSSTPSTDRDIPPSTSQSPSPSIAPIGSNLPSDSTNDSHLIAAVGGGAGGAAQDHGSIMPVPGSVSREKSVLLRLNERVKNVEENVSLLSSYVEQVTNSLRKNKNKTDEVQRALDRNLQTLNEAMQEMNATIAATVQRLKRVEEELESKSFDSIEAQLESIGKTVLNQQLLLFTLSCLTAVLTLLLIVLIFFLCLIRGCGQKSSQRVQSVGIPAAAMSKSNVKMVHSIGGGVVLEDDVAASKVAQHSRVNLTVNHENLELLEKKKRKGKRNSH